jgi:protocatechuate 3,4-dioxygenase beta subunit
MLRLAIHLSFRLSLLLIGLVAWPVRAQTTLAGRVLDLDSGRPLPDVRVALCAPEGARPPAHPATWTDADGRYTLRGVPSGVWCVRAVYVEQDVGYLVQSPSISLAEGALVIHFRMPTSLGERLRHTLAPTDPNPKSLSVITGYLQDGFATDADGRALAGSRTGFETYQAGILRGRVTRDGRPVADALLVLVDLDRQTRTDAEGRFELDGLAPGTHPLHVVHHPDTLNIPSVAIEKGLNLLNFSFRKAN